MECEIDEEKIEIEFVANEYRDLVNIEGADKELVLGENVININMRNTDENEKSYKIIVSAQLGTRPCCAKCTAWDR